MKKLVVVLGQFGGDISDVYMSFIRDMYKGDTIIEINTPDDTDETLAKISDQIDDALVKEINSLPGGMVVAVADEPTVLNSFALTISEMYGCDLICLSNN